MKNAHACLSISSLHQRLLALVLAVLLAPGCSQEPETSQAAEPARTAAPAPQPAAAAPAAVPAASTAQADTPAGATAPVWEVNSGESTLGFDGTYAGTGFNGVFREFTALIRFDPDAPETSYFDVNIDITSLTTFNDDWDSVLVGRDWFWFSKYPNSHYVTKTIERQGDNHFLAHGTLELKGKQGDVDLDFTWETLADGSARVQGSARLNGNSIVNRVAFGIGEGQYATDSNIIFDVPVKVDLLLTPAAE